MKMMVKDLANLSEKELLTLRDYIQRRLDLLNVRSDARDVFERQMIEVKARMAEIGAQSA